MNNAEKKSGFFLLLQYEKKKLDVQSDNYIGRIL